MNECAECPDNTVSTGGAVLCTPCEAGKEPNSERTECGEGFQLSENYSGYSTNMNIVLLELIQICKWLAH